MQINPKYILYPSILLTIIVSIFLIYRYGVPNLAFIVSRFEKDSNEYLTPLDIKTGDINTDADLDGGNKGEDSSNSNIITYANTPAYKGSKYFIEYFDINNTILYLAYPITIDSDNPPDIAIFLHGNNTTVTKDLKTQNMKDMMSYSDTLINGNYAFGALEIPNDLWDSATIVENINLARKKIIKSYPTTGNFNIIAFSKGGIPAFNYAFKYPNNVNSMALLAPARREYTSTQLNRIKDIPIKIWHGVNDVNVGISISDTLLSQYNGGGYKNMTLIRLPNTDHFAVDTEYRKQILKYFKENE